MRVRHSSRGRVVGALVGALLLLADTAGAHHLTFDVALSNYSANAYSDVTFFMDFGSAEPSSLKIEFPTGWQFAQETGTSPLTPTPSDEEQIGSGLATARWEPFCFANSNLSLTITWEDNMTGAPANAVAHYQITGGLFTTDAWVIRNGAGDYDLEIPNFPDEFICSSTTNHNWTLTIWGTTADGDRVLRNPTTAGTYQFTLLFTDTTGTLHSTTDSVTVA